MKPFSFVLILMLICSCAKKTKKLAPVEANAAWLKTSTLYNHKSEHGDYLVHPFFDLIPYASKKDSSINFVITMPVGGKNKFQIDLRSGKLYREHKMCSEKDIWGKYGSTLGQSPYTEGFVPRLLDQLGGPQKIIIFGKKRYFYDFELAPTRSQRVRVVGAVLQQYCESFPCRGRNKWLSRMVLVAVNSNDPAFTKVTHINQLKKIVDWAHVKAVLENSDGRHVSTSEESPAYRVIGNLGPKESLVNAISKGHLFQFKEMQSLRSNCFKLYDHLWNSAEGVRNFKERYTQEEKKKNRIIDKTDTFSGNVISAERSSVSEEQIQQQIVKLKNFSTFFNSFHNNYKKRFLTCQKFVRDTSINANPRRMWFFSYLSAFLYAEEVGFRYSCSRQAWIANPMQSNGKRLKSLNNYLRNCTAKELDRAFDMSVTLFAGLSRSHRPHFRYIEYDHGAGASHQKMYTWIQRNGDTRSCDKNRQAKLSIFPRDVSWESFKDHTKRKRTDLIE
jgi:hypothetical protein